MAVLDAFMGISEDFASENQPQEILVPMIKHELLCDYVTDRHGVWVPARPELNIYYVSYI